MKLIKSTRPVRRRLRDFLQLSPRLIFVRFMVLQARNHFFRYGSSAGPRRSSAFHTSGPHRNSSPPVDCLRNIAIGCILRLVHHHDAAEAHDGKLLAGFFLISLFQNLLTPQAIKFYFSKLGLKNITFLSFVVLFLLKRRV